jgi:hypothetical protein
MEKNTKKILISESEKDYILKMYGIVKEQKESGKPIVQKQKVQDKPKTTGQPNPIEQKQLKEKSGQQPKFSKEIKITFPPGYYSENFLDKKELTPLINEVRSIITDKNITNSNFIEVFITVKSGESLIPPYDNEKKVPLKTGDLAKFRKDTINKYLGEEISKYLLDRGKVFINNVEPIIGKTPWDPAEYKKNPQKYINEQFVYVDIDVFITSKNYTCLNGMTIDINYETPGDHKCNNAVYQLFINNVLINRDNGKPYGNLNNDGKFDEGKDIAGSRYNRFVVNDKLARQIINNKITSEGLPVTIKCVNAGDVGGEVITSEAWGDGCHESVGDIVITPHLSKQTTVLRGGTPNKRGESVIVGMFNACGGKTAESQVKV